MDKGYTPLTSILGISGTSYALQLGKINDQLACKIIKGRETIAFNLFREMIISDPINVNKIVGWVITTLYIPNVNPYHIQRTVNALMKSLNKNLEKM